MFRLISALILFCLILVFSAFAIVNRNIVLVRFDLLSLFDSELPIGDFIKETSFIFEAPLFLIIFAAILIGIFIGMALPIMHFLRKQRIALREKLQRLKRQTSASTASEVLK